MPTLAATPAQTRANLQSVVTAIQNVPAGTTPPPVVLQPETSDQVTSVVAAINDLAPATGTNPPTVTVMVDLGSQSVSNTALDVPAGAQVVLSGSSATVDQATINGGSVTVEAGVTPSNWTVNGGNVVVQGTATAGDFTVNAGTVTLADGTVITGNSPAITVNGGTVILQGVTAQTATNSPTIVVNGGSLIVRGSTIQESTNYTQAAILITGGTVDLGTAASPGGNTFNINGAGQFLEDTTSIPVSDIGNTLEVNGAPLSAADLSFTALGSSAVSSVFGQPVTLTASVGAANPADGAPTGSVEFVDTTTGTDLGTVPVSNGVASITASALAVGSHAISADYHGDGLFAFSLGTLTQTVEQDATTTTVSSSASSANLGTTLTFTATLSVNTPGSDTPTGMVTFYDGAVNPSDEIGTGTLSTSSSGVTTATFTTHTLSVGTDTITAVYGGDTNDQGSTSSVFSQSITPAPLLITAQNQTKVYGQANPALSVSYSGFVNGDTSAKLTTLPTVTTTATTTSAVGSYPITASGAVDPNYTISYVAGTLTISPDATTTVAGSSATSIGAGQSVTLSATVAATAPGSGTPAGIVDFLDTTTGDDLGSVSLSGGEASLSTASLPVGGNSIKVSYSDTVDSNFLASSATISTITINQSIIVLDPTAGGALSLSGNASIKLSGGVFVDSSSSTALSASGNATVRASVIEVHGGVQKSGNASFSPSPTTGTAILADPLASLAEPSTSGLTSYGSESLSGNSSATIKPGIYSQISASGNGTLTLDSGIYIIEGGGFSVSGNASVTGSGVMIFNAGSKYPTTGGTYGGITLSGNGSYNLSAPATGTCAGIVIFQSRDNTKALTLSGNASGMTGTIYAPAAPLAESGNAQLNAAAIVDTMTISGNSISNTVTLSSPSGTVAYTPAQIRSAYGVSALALDGTGQTIAIVDAYDDPNIFQALDAFDSQFGLTSPGSSLYDQYGPASSFLTVLNQNGQATSLPSADPNGPGTDNWEVEEALDVEWAHAIAPGAQIILVEANSQSLSDLMASVATAASQPGVSVVSMSWGFPEGQAVFAADEAAYDSVFDVPGVTFVASTGDFGAADPEYPSFSPNVVAVGGTSLTLNADGSYNSETGWGYYSDAAGALIASGGGISLYEPEPAYQAGVQSTGGRTTPDVSFVADPATGAWIADPYNLGPSNPFEIVGGTSLSAPAWAGLVALVNQGRAAVGESTLNSTSPTDTQQALYMLPQSDYNAITSGDNGYTAGAGYNLVTGLGTPIANLMVPDLITYTGPGTTYSGPTVGPLQNAGLVSTGSSDSGPIDVFSVFDSFTVSNVGLSHAGVKGATRQEKALGQMTNAAGRADRSLANLQEGSSIVSRSAVRDGLAQPLPRSAAGLTSAVDQVLGVLVETNSHDTLIGDLAFELVSSATRKPRGSAAIGPSS